jgi:hypothetical protein
MIGELGIILMTFRVVFPRGATFHWFVVAVFGFIVRLDHHGVSSSVRWLGVRPDLYETFLAFFRSGAVKLEKVMRHWQLLVADRYAVRTQSGAFILIGDGIKTAKEAEYMPGVKKLHQESENSGKAPWIYGHHFGVVGMLAGGLEKLFCIPLAAELHEGAAALRKLQGKEPPKVNGVEKTTVTTLMGNLLTTVVSNLAHPCVAVLDAYFAAAPVFAMAKALCSKDGTRLLHIITRAKGNVVAREQEPAAYCGRGRRPKYGKRIKLAELFTSKAEDFSSVVVNVYGETKSLLILCLDLVWNDTLRFVLVKDGNDSFILICSDLTMAPEEIVSLYSKRFKIEITFKMYKHIIGGFCYHFWTKAWQVPKDQPFNLEQLKDMPERTQRLLADAMNAVEAFVNFALIAIGTLQMLAIAHAKEIRKRHSWWMRTYSSEVPSKEMVKRLIQHEFYHNFRKFKHTAIYRIIQDKRGESAPSKRLQSTAVPLKEAA